MLFYASYKLPLLSSKNSCDIFRLRKSKRNYAPPSEKCSRRKRSHAGDATPHTTDRHRRQTDKRRTSKHRHTHKTNAHTTPHTTTNTTTRINPETCVEDASNTRPGMRTNLATYRTHSSRDPSKDPSKLSGKLEPNHVLQRCSATNCTPK